MARLGVLVLATGLFVVLAVTSFFVGILPGDTWAREALLAWAPAPLTAAMGWINYAGSWLVLFPSTVLLLGAFARLRRRWWIWLALMVVTPMLEGALKELVGRARPQEDSFGFPSGHATAAAAYFGLVIHAAGELRPAARVAVRVAAAVMIVLVGLARILLRAHWPSDVVGGIALGLACAAGAVLISGSTLRSPAGSTPPAPPVRD